MIPKWVRHMACKVGIHKYRLSTWPEYFYIGDVIGESYFAYWYECKRCGAAKRTYKVPFSSLDGPQKWTVTKYPPGTYEGEKDEHC